MFFGRANGSGHGGSTMPVMGLRIAIRCLSNILRV